MIQDIAPHIFDNQYKNIAPQEKDFLLVYDGKNVLVKEGEEGICFPLFSELQGEYSCIYLFSIDEKNFFLGSKWMEGELDGYEWKDIQIYRNAIPKHLGFAAITGWQLYRWYDIRKYCGRCGTRMDRDSKERMMKCPKCGQMEFPKICPQLVR
jgi:NAD+ diphosphatase